MKNAVVTSTTDSPEAVAAASGMSAQPKTEVEAKPPVAETKPAESTKESGALEPETEEPEADGDEPEAGDSDESEGDEPKDADGKEKPKKKSGFQRKVNKLTKRAAAAQQEAEFWKAEALKAKAQETKPEAEKKPETVSNEGKPKQDDFATVAEYYEAVADWKFDQREKAKTAKEREESVKTDQQKRIQEHVQKLEAFKKDHTDFDDLIEDVEDVPMSIAVQEAILSSENGPELMYELAKNRKEYERICKLPPMQAAKELGKFEAKIEKPSVADAITGKTTKAPPPLTPVSSKKASPTKNPDEMPYQEYKKWREAQLGRP